MSCVVDAKFAKHQEFVDALLHYIQLEHKRAAVESSQSEDPELLGEMPRPVCEHIIRVI